MDQHHIDFQNNSVLIKSKGTIICISSIAGISVLGAPIPYAISKSALNTFVKNSARPLAKNGIRINAVAPGNIMFKNSVWERKSDKSKENVGRKSCII